MRLSSVFQKCRDFSIQEKVKTGLAGPREGGAAERRVGPRGGGGLRGSAEPRGSGGPSGSGGPRGGGDGLPWFFGNPYETFFDFSKIS